jgi:hypothetical protein
VSIKLRGKSAGAMSIALLLLSGCGREHRQTADKPDMDPGLTGSLQGPVMTDPDLDHLNTARNALTGGGAPVIELPPIESGTEAIAAAKSDAAKIVKKAIAALASPQALSDSGLSDAITPAQLARSVKGPGKNCADRIEYGLAWSLRLPDVLAIYPRGHLQEAAGTDRDGCRLRVVSFASPVDAADILAFYAARLKSNSLSVRYAQSPTVQVLDGSNAGLAYFIRARKISQGISGVDIVVNGSWPN